MKRIYNALIALVLIIVTFSACHQKNTTTTVKAKKTKQTVKTIIKNDTLIFKDTALAALVNQTDKYFSIYDTISPMGDTYDIKSFKLSKSDFKALRSLANDSIPSTIMSGGDIISALSGWIESNLTDILKSKNIGDYDLSLLLKNYLSSAKSPDNKLYCFSFDEKTGGSYRSSICIMYYNPGGKESPKIFSTGDSSIFNHDGYGIIDTINTKQGIKYLLSGSVAGCNTCTGNYIDLVHFEKGDFVTDFNYNVETRDNYDDGDNTPTIAYNVKQHHININYTTSDLTPVCNCGKDGPASDDPDVSYENNGNEDKVTCTYAFNGKTFVLKKKREKPMTPSK